MATASPVPFDDGRQFVTLGVDDEIFAVDVGAVREILERRPLTRIPNAPPFLIGMIDVRGGAVPVMDVRIKLGLPPAPPTDQTRIIVLDTMVHGRSLSWGLLADRVFEVAPLDDSHVEPPPEIGVRWRSDYIHGLGRRNGALVIVIDLERLFSSEEAALLAGVDA